ncbi:Peptidase family M23 [Jatrophihabitans endophyticus]|uniref:Peptidase family M23 n=1 Tax=Jatrophihabitans endophyticus TaxID=1206085 RepID=A0A1M5CC83_9ACTN|nr:peptidoglycan DD-metalloendopeptidase family protein [Jatrophihabitans endophyticus]SHF52286.1 Peptidase family M23 [Jatrophihabitans endophyticus]
MRALPLVAAAFVALATAPADGPNTGSAPLPSTGSAARAGPAVPVAMPVAVRYAPPVVPLRVVRPFDPPLDPYGPGHRGIDLLSRVDSVLAAAAGVVTFAGAVAGRGVVVVTHADGIRTEYEPLRPAVTRGERVRLGQVIGTLRGRHPGCPRPRCLHWGARRGGSYLDPLSLLRRLGAVRLLPWPRTG